MKVLILLLSLVGIVASEYCYDNLMTACDGAEDAVIKKCDGKYGGINDLSFGLQSFANLHINKSFEYLLHSAHFGTYEVNRGGFEKLFRKLSDDTWQDAIEVIKHIAKRGGQMNFRVKHEDNFTSRLTSYELAEMQALARVLDSQKHLAEESFKLHGAATRHRAELHDPEIGSYLENNFVHKHADTIRDLAGHFNDLDHMVKKKDGLPIFLFDEYLKTKYE